MSRTHVLVVLAVFVAGCNQPASETATSKSATPSFTTTVVEPANLTTDIIHLRQAPEVSPAQSMAPDATRIELHAVSDEATYAVLGQTIDTEWRLALPNGLPGLLGNISATFEVVGPVLGDPRPSGTACFWWMSLSFNNTTDSEQPPTILNTCLGPEPPQVTPGRRHLEAKFNFQRPVPAGSTLTISFYAGTIQRPTGSHTQILVDSNDDDAAIRLIGLAIPTSE